MDQSSAQEDFKHPRFLDVGPARVCYRTAGTGPAIVLLHGFPLSGLSWRKIVPSLATRFTCIALDLIGLGDTRSINPGDYASEGQATVFQRTLARLGVSSYALVGNDTGGWIARELALLDTPRVTHLALMNTEMPGHRPPWIPLYQRTAELPGSRLLFRWTLNSRWLRRSPMGFGGCFANLDAIDGEFTDLFIAPLVASDERLDALIRFLVSMKFPRLDRFRELHAKLTMPVAFVWAAADPTFPEPIARAMASQFPNVAHFWSLPGGKLLVHEEQPDAVANLLIGFLTGRG